MPLEGETLSIFRDAVQSPYTRDHYERHLKYFVGFVGLDPDSVIKRAKEDTSWCEKEVLAFIQKLKRRVESKTLSRVSIGNYTKPIRLFLEMNDILLNWRKINRLIPSGKSKANDRIPTVDEIKRLLNYPDRRIKPIVLVMVSGGVRVGAWNYLSWGDVDPIEIKGKIVAAKITVYRGEPEEHQGLISPEAYQALKEYMDFRADGGEKTGVDSPLIRNLWHGDRGGRGEPHLPIRLKSTVIQHLVEHALWGQGLRKKLPKGKKRHEFKADHGFRKFHETACIKSRMNIIHIKMLRGDSTGLEEAYYRPSFDDMLNDYLLAIAELTIDSPIDSRKDSEGLQLRLDSLSEENRALRSDVDKIYEALEKRSRERMKSVTYQPSAGEEVYRRLEELGLVDH